MNEQTSSIEKVFYENGYITDQPTLVALKLVQALKKPLLLEGPAGVGKTEIAKVLAKSLDTKLIRLQCYEGLDVHSALYEWNYAKQMLHIRLTENTQLSVDERESTIYGKEFLLSRPLLEAFTESEAAPVLLIDEIDRADEAFEAFLLEALAEFQITIPEIGTIKAKQQPYIILTSNRTRELSDALRRRCLYQWVSFPDYKKEVSILQTRLPELNQNLAEQIAKFMESIRQIPLQKVPGVAESLDWARALIELHQSELNKDTVRETLGCFLKNHDDWDKVEKELNQGTLLRSNG
ncbi:AAA family ATPase [Oceanobacillus sp. 143]|uniref:ATPase n=1 Tax=Oceanobacillus zhaokaii TaxID=2052660 RepID=A0A345PK05_9BACI|nr:MoxR family ATPase [Oceanobacillus zhaokaii]AXI10335.1 ATPase [Oceanobacillus zhaokaii]QGS69383.1 AAA family ATPase [Oceanobacillus sp. 143]